MILVCTSSASLLPDVGNINKRSAPILNRVAGRFDHTIIGPVQLHTASFTWVIYGVRERGDFSEAGDRASMVKTGG